MKEVLFPKVFAAREQCREHGGVGGMPLWSNPSLGSPRDPWVVSDAFGRVRDKSDASSNNQASSSAQHNHLLDSAEIKEDASGGGEGQSISHDPMAKPESAEAAEAMECGKNVFVRGKPGPLSSQGVDDFSIQGDNSQENRVEEEAAERLSITAVDGRDLPESSTRENQEGHPSGSFGLLVAREDISEHLHLKETVMEVRDVLNVILVALVSSSFDRLLSVGGIRRSWTRRNKVLSHSTC